MVRAELGQVIPNEVTRNERIVYFGRTTLYPRQLEVLRHMALGQSNKQIARELGISFHTVAGYKSNSTKKGESKGIFEKLGAVDSLNAVLEGIDSGELALEELTQGYDFARFDSMTQKETEVLMETIRDNGRFSSNKEIASRLNIRLQTLKNHFRDIFDKLDLYGDGSKARAAVLFAAWQEKLREEEEHRYSGA